ncbi:MAG: DUF4140 domain-containing protein [Bacteroidota bacterium]
MKRSFLVFLFACNVLFAQASKLTIYNSGFAVVEETINVNLKNGRQEFLIDNLPSSVIPNSLMLKLNGNIYSYSFFRKSLFNEILSNSINKDATVYHKFSNEKLNGKILSFFPNDNPRLILKKPDNSIVLLSNLLEYDIEIKELPDNVSLNNKYYFDIEPIKSGPQNINLNYQINDIYWNAQHFLIINDQTNSATLSSDFQIFNNSGKDFKNVKMKLIYGDVPKPIGLNDVSQEQDYGAMRFSPQAAKMNLANTSEEELSGLFIYDLKDDFSILNQQFRKISYKSADNVKIFKKKYAFSSFEPWQNAGGKVDIFNVVELVNSKDNGLGFTIPKGVFSVYSINKEDIEFVGEIPTNGININNTEVLKLSKAFNINGREEIQNVDFDGTNQIETYRYSFSNQANTAEDIVLLISGDFTNIKILSSSHKYKLEGKRTLRIDFKLNENSEEQIIIKTQRMQNRY